MSRRTTLTAVGLLLTAAALVSANAGAPGSNDDKFSRLKALVGSWTEAGGDGSVSVTYKLTGAGSAVVETLHPGKPDEMITVYTIDKGDIVMTHYCAAGNQPHMKAAKGGDPSVIAFKFDGAGNLGSPKDGHMHDLEISFVGPDRVKASWHFYTDGRESEVKSFDFTRMKS